MKNCGDREDLCIGPAAPHDGARRGNPGKAADADGDALVLPPRRREDGNCFVTPGPGQTGRSWFTLGREFEHDLASQQVTLNAGLSAIRHVGSRHRRNDLTGSYDRARIVRDIDVEGRMHHLV